MGIPTDLFLGSSTSINPELICRVCKGVLEDPIGLKPCHHSICKKCVHVDFEGVKVKGPVNGNNVSASGSASAFECPIDGKLITGTQAAPRIYVNDIDDLALRCAFHADGDGCPVILRVKNFFEHRKTCKFNPENGYVKVCASANVNPGHSDDSMDMDMDYDYKYWKARAKKLEAELAERNDNANEIIGQVKFMLTTLSGQLADRIINVVLEELRLSQSGQGLPSSILDVFELQRKLETALERANLFCGCGSRSTSWKVGLTECETIGLALRYWKVGLNSESAPYPEPTQSHPTLRLWTFDNLCIDIDLLDPEPYSRNNKRRKHMPEVV